MLLKAVEEVIADKGFQVSSPLAAAALQAATALHTWMEDPANVGNATQFAGVLYSKLHKALEVSAKKFHKRREKMWGSYHTIRTCDEFVLLWKRFLDSASCEPSPILFQNLTDRVFRMMMKVAFPVVESSSSAVTPPPLTHTELNALRYAAGYVCKTLRNKIKRMEPENAQLELSLEELIEDNNDEDDNGDRDGNEDRAVTVPEVGEVTIPEDGAAAIPDVCAATIPSSCEWTRLVNRGGLLQVTDDAFDVFTDVEEVVRTYYCKSRVKEISVGKRDEMIEKVMQDEQVMEDWSYVAVDMDKEIERKLLKMVIEEWVKIRGFSFANAWLEQYKSKIKKTLQRSKGLRKNLISIQDTNPNT